MKRKPPIPVVVLLLVALAAGGWWWWRSRQARAPANVLRASGTVEATEARMGFETGGRLLAVGPHEGDAVAAGAELARLDPAELQARRAQAAAQVAAAAARLAELQAGPRGEEIAQAEAQRRAAAEQLGETDRELARTRTLVQGGATPREALDKAQTARDVAAQRVKQTAEQVALLRRGARREQLEAQRAVVEQARAAVAAADVALGNTSMRAPFAGIVSVRHREPGEVVGPGAPVLTLLRRDDRWVRIYVPEDRLGAVPLGAAAVLRSDTYPGKTYRGTVVHLASEAEFTPKNVQTQEERVRLVYAAKVRIDDDPRFELKPGLPVDVEISLLPAKR
ncbi:MAG TPA: HlyD family efflux transporter periplasmic adaptor subunit [Thermoanaerobaculia bacterium]|jgi:HlyD family secretion protein|nr:HlyD family efflux transporter periplasmic adaptor subunit [Thermoanaerobaculia bacterium]